VTSYLDSSTPRSPGVGRELGGAGLVVHKAGARHPHARVGKKRNDRDVLGPLGEPGLIVGLAQLTRQADLESFSAFRVRRRPLRCTSRGCSALTIVVLGGDRGAAIEVVEGRVVA